MVPSQRPTFRVGLFSTHRQLEYRVQDGDATGPNESTETTANPLAASPPVGEKSSATWSRTWVRRGPDAPGPRAVVDESVGNQSELDLRAIDLRDIEEEWDRLEDLPDAEVLKSNLARQVISLPATDRRPAVLVKRYRVRGKSERWKYAFLPSRAAREWRALTELESAGFPTPRPIAMFEERDGRWLREAGLVMELLEEVYPVPDLVFADPSGEPARDELLRSCGRLVARLHHKGIGHPDLHLGNFLGNPDDSTDVRLVDLHAVHHLSVVRSPRRRSDLAKLIHSLGGDIDRHSVRQVIEAYLAECALTESAGGFLGKLEEEIDLVLIEAQSVERIRLRSRDRRCWGTTSQFISEKKGAWQIYRRREFSDESLAPLLDGSWIALPTWKELRSGPEEAGFSVSEVELPTESGPQTFVVKVRKSSFFGGCVDRIARGPLERAWGAARSFEVRGVPHERAFALAIERRRGRNVRTILVTEKLEGQTLADAVVERSSDPRVLNRFLRQATDTVAPLLRQLHRSGIYHRDTNPSNWLVENVEPAGSSIILLNLESIHASHSLSLRRRRVNLVQLALLPGGRAMQSLRLRFLLRYHTGELIYPAWLGALDSEFAERQVEEIEKRVARERGGVVSADPERPKDASPLAKTDAGPKPIPASTSQADSAIDRSSLSALTTAPLGAGARGANPEMKDLDDRPSASAKGA